MKAAAILAFLAAPALAQPPVRVVLDMDAATPGIQNFIRVQAGTTIVPGVAMYIYDPLGTRTIQSIGYVGGLDRGIAIGHTPSNFNIGAVTSLTGHPGTPITSNGYGYLSGGIQKGFDGPELHYLEGGDPAVLPSAPASPVCTVDIHLSGASVGDEFRIYLLDMVTVWRTAWGPFHSGAFSTTGTLTLDTGGDCVPDGTATTEGLDPDAAVPVPPAAFLVDYIDGPGGAPIVVVPACYANCDNSAGSPTLTANDFQCFMNRFAAGHAYANCDSSTGTPVLTANDFQCFLNQFAGGCS